MKKKVALLYHGQVGIKNRHGNIVDFQRSFTNHKNTIINNKTCEVDIFMHMWETPKEKDVLSVFKPKRWISKPQIDFKMGQKYSSFLKNNKREIKLHNLKYSFMYGLKESIQLMRQEEKESGLNYDFAIKTRYDNLIGWKFDFNQLNPNSFYTHEFNKRKNNHNPNTPSILDLFWVSSPDNIEKISSCYEALENYMENPKFTSVWDTSFEEMWTWHLKQINIYNKVKWLDWIKNPITLDRFFSKKSYTHISCSPFTGWKNQNKYSEKNKKIMENSIYKFLK